MSRKAVGRWQLERRLGAGSFASVFLASRRPDGGAVAALDAGLRQDGLKKNDAGDDGADGDVQSHTAENQSQYGMIGNNAGPWPERVAIKAISRSKLTKKLERNLQKEVSILQGLVHDNIVALLETVETGRHIYLVMEYCAGGDLHALLKSTGPLPVDLARHFVRQLADGMHFLWSQNLIHRDLKPHNLLLTERSIRGVLKIADFGFATHLEAAAMADTMCGSPLYMAPEVLDGKRYDSRADLWSAGTILFEMLIGKPPFQGSSPRELLRNILRSPFRFPLEKRDCPGDCISLLQSLLMADPNQRITFEEFYEHPFLREDINPDEAALRALSSSSSSDSEDSNLPDSADEDSDGEFKGKKKELTTDDDPPHSSGPKAKGLLDRVVNGPGPSSPSEETWEIIPSSQPESFRNRTQSDQQPSRNSPPLHRRAFQPLVRGASGTGLSNHHHNLSKQPNHQMGAVSGGSTQATNLPRTQKQAAPGTAVTVQALRFAGELTKRIRILVDIARDLASDGEADFGITRNLTMAHYRNLPSISLVLIVKALKLLTLGLDATEQAAGVLDQTLLRAARVTRDEVRSLYAETARHGEQIRKQARQMASMDRTPSAENLMIEIALQLGQACATSVLRCQHNGSGQDQQTSSKLSHTEANNHELDQMQSLGETHTPQETQNNYVEDTDVHHGEKFILDGNAGQASNTDCKHGDTSTTPHDSGGSEQTPRAASIRSLEIAIVILELLTCDPNVPSTEKDRIMGLKAVFLQRKRRLCS